MLQMYSDISHILAAKAQRRRMLAALSWEEKVAIIERMRSVTRDMWKEITADKNDVLAEPEDRQKGERTIPQNG